MEIRAPIPSVLDSTSSTNDLDNQVGRQEGSSFMEQAGRQLGAENNVDDELHTGTGIRSRSRESASGATTFQGPVGGDIWDHSRSAAEIRQDKSPKQSSSHRQPQQFTPNPAPLNSPGSLADIPVPPPPQRLNKPTPPEFRKFQLKISRSYTNHHEYIERQGYYGGFNVDTSSIMAEDLQNRVPLEGMADCQLKKPEVALWVKDMKKDKLGKQRPTLRQMWEEGRRERGEKWMEPRRCRCKSS